MSSDEHFDNEKTPIPNNVIPLHKDFITETADRLTFSEKKIYNISDDVNLILNVRLPVMDRKLDRILDGQREMNKLIMKQSSGKLKAVWAGIVLAYGLLVFLLVK